MTAVLLSPVLLLSTASPAAAHIATDSDGSLEVVQLPAAPGHLSELAPGDRTEWAAQVTNTTKDTLPLYVTFSTTGTDPLLTDPQHGLQLDVTMCPRPLNIRPLESGPVVYTCPTTPQLLGAGAAAALGELKATTTLGPGATVGVRARVLLPVSAGNALENTAGELHAHFATTGASTSIPGRPGSAPDPIEPTPPATPLEPAEPTRPGPTAPGGGPVPSPGDPPHAPGSAGATGAPAAAGPADPGSHTGNIPGGAAGNDPGGAVGDDPAEDSTGGSLAQTGRNLLAAALGAVATMILGAVLLGAARRAQTQENP